MLARGERTGADASGAVVLLCRRCGTGSGEVGRLDESGVGGVLEDGETDGGADGSLDSRAYKDERLERASWRTQDAPQTSAEQSGQ